MSTDALRLRVEQALGVAVSDSRPLGGGDAADARRMTTADGRDLFVKTVRDGDPFAAEALGLQRMNLPDGVRVPGVLHVEPRLLVLEYIDFGRPGPDHQRLLGEQLAVTHGVAHTAYGFDVDHYIGLTPQKNLPWIENGPGAWAEFWWTHRLEPMLHRLRDPGLRDRAARLETRVPDVIGDSAETPRLLHGDLWAGNVAADEHGAPVIFDPAPYYGHREADLAMTRMFGGFTPEFYDAYTATAPLPDGWRERLDFYMLYHVLNHVVIFGSGYAGQAERILQAYL